jgi:uncharacterized membrane protein YcaP (DUF421 family)
MDTIQYLVGEGEQLTPLQMSVRTFVTCIFLLILLRVAGQRTFAKRSAFDNIIVILLGAVLARGVVGASPYWATVASSVLMVAMHRLIAWLAVKSRNFEKLVKGTYIKLYHNGALVNNNLEKTGMSENDLHESLRLETKKLTLSEIDTAFMETNGRISFILKTKDQEGQ